MSKHLNIDNIADTIQETADYLYKIDADVTHDQFQAISTLRQLINECFEPKKQVSNQFIYDHIKEVLK